jgi:16S rRNA (cytosine967-C5)-methyltransferase
LSPAPSGAAAAVLAAAARALSAVVFAGCSAEEAIDRAGAAPELRAAVRAVTLGSLRWYFALDPIIARLLQDRPIVPLLQALLIAALHQLEHSRNPAATIVSSAVDAARVLGQPRAAALINALLRRYTREREALRVAVLQSSEAVTAHPAWLLTALRSAYPDQWQEITAANNTHPPMSLRIDLSRSTREAYLERLRDAGRAAQPVPWVPSAVALEVPLPVAELPGFTEGVVSVQDAGAQLAATLLEVQAGERVLDACAAPGGKSGALLEAAAGPIELTALDIDAGRLELVQENLVRLRRSARLIAADLRSEPSWWDGMGFDRILLDAPCSSTGVIRRHPDIKLLRLPGDIAAFAATQRSLLDRCLRLLKPGGRLLYSTCSLLPDENEQVVGACLLSNPQARLVPLQPGPAPPPWLSRSLGMQLLPSNEARTDGFYYACLTVT